MILIAVFAFIMIFIGFMVFVTGLGQTISFGSPQYTIIGIILTVAGIVVNYKYGWKK